MVENEGGRIVIGQRFCVWSHLGRVELYAGPGGTLTIGDDVFVNHGAVLSASCEIHIGNRVNIAPRCTLLDNDFHGTDERGAAPRKAPIILEDDVWLGTGVIVLRGVKIGHGAVIAAGAVVSRDVPAGMLAGGVPARVLRPLSRRAQAP
jgi:acetyltransferase-like isoleucine patch superfamily enzyme